MTSSARQDIRDALVTLLGTITGIGSVSTRARIFFHDIPVDQFPALDVIVGQEIISYNPTDDVDSTINVIIRGSVNATDAAAETSNGQVQIENLIRDVKNKLASDFTLAGKVIDLVPTNIITDEGFLITPTFQMTVRVRHEHDFGGA